jgi:hypothetical protein
MIDLASDINLNHFIAPERSRPQSVVPIGQGPARAGIAEAGDTHIQLDRILPAMSRQVEDPANVLLGQSITWHWLANLCDRGQKLPQRALARRRTRPWPRRPGVAESKDLVQLNARGHHSFRGRSNTSPGGAGCTRGNNTPRLQRQDLGVNIGALSVGIVHGFLHTLTGSKVRDPTIRRDQDGVVAPGGLDDVARSHRVISDQA